MRIAVAGCLVVLTALSSVAQDEVTARRSEIRSLPLQALLEQLRDDDVRRNAMYATLYLYEYISDPVLNRLHELLNSDDWQQRQLAAWLLRRERPIPWTERLVEVTVEGLKDDALPVGEKTKTFFFTCQDGVSSLMAYPLAFPGPLVEALVSDDVQQRFWCSFILASKQHRESFDRTIPYLMTHLGNDRVRCNAGYAAKAIFDSGPRNRSRIEPLLDSGDQQARQIVRFILANWDDPDAGPSRLPKNHPDRVYYSRWAINPLQVFNHHYVIRFDAERNHSLQP